MKNQSNASACWSAIARAAIVFLVIYAPWLQINMRESFLLAAIFSSLWAIDPLWRHWRASAQPVDFESGYRDTPGKTKAVVGILIVALAAAQVQAQPLPSPPPDKEFTALEGVLAVAIVVLTGYGYYRCYVKAKKTTKKAGQKKTRQIEETNPWPDDPNTQTNTVASKTSGPSLPTEYGAWLYEALPAGDPTDCECRPMPVIEWVTPESGQAKARLYFPDNPIELGDYLADHGLTESTNANYSLNGEPTLSAPSIFTYTNRTLTFAIPGTVNRTSILQRSPDLDRWETIFTVKSPARMVNNFADGTLAEAGRQFYRVMVLP